MKHLNLTTTLATLIAVTCIVCLFFLGSLFGRDPVSIGLQIAAVVLMLWARRVFGGRSFHFTASPTEGGLVTRGPYAYIRHPIYSAVILFLWAGVLYGLSPLPLLLRIIATGAMLVRVFSEERLLRAEYPEYAEYAGRTKRIIPFVF